MEANPAFLAGLDLVTTEVVEARVAGVTSADSLCPPG